MRFVITGATSMIGAALVQECLKHNVQVVALIRASSKNADRLPKSDLVQIVDCTLENLAQIDPDKIGSCDVFYHIAWANTDKVGRLNPELQQQNIAYTLAALELAHKLGCKKFIGAGSQAEYGIHVDMPTRPDSQVLPQMAYGVCKYAAGRLGELRAKQLNMDFLWVRIFSVYGANDIPGTMIRSTLEKLLQGQHCSFTEGTHCWDYLHSTDAGRAFFLIGQKSHGHKIYCLGSGIARPLREYIEIMRDLAAPGSVLGFGEIPYPDGRGINLQADISSLVADTGWKPQISFADGIVNILLYMKR